MIKLFCSTASKYISEFPKKRHHGFFTVVICSPEGCQFMFPFFILLQCSENVSSQKMYNRGICFLKVPLIKLFQGILELSIPAR